MKPKAILLLLSLPALAMCQQPPPSPPAALSNGLKIFVLEGAGTTNSLVQPVPSMVVVEVRDQNDRPIEGADVTFELPMTGPGGQFSDNQFVRTARTNAQGQAGITFLPNPVAGRFEIKVSAKLANRAGQTVIYQSNGVPGPAEKRGIAGLGKWKLILIGGGAAAVVASILIVTHGSGSSTPAAAPPPTITVSPGTPTFGVP